MDEDILFDYADDEPSDLDQFEMDCLRQEQYWDCLECSAPPEFLEDCPQ